MKKFIQNSGKVYEDVDKQAIQEWLDSGEEIPWGTYYDRFEKELAKYIGVKHSIFVNSGSSANLLAFATMYHYYGLKPGDEIITVAASFPTTVAPIVQYGCVPVFVDVDLGTYNINIEALRKAAKPTATNRIKGVFIAHTLGNPFDIQAVLDICVEHNLFLIEDACDAFGSLYKGSNTGSFGHMSTTSFYPAHEMSTGGGGAIFTDNDEMYKIAYSLSHWGRACLCPPSKDGICGKRFSQQHGGLPYGFDHKYTFDYFGYNLMSTNMQAALGLAQLARIDKFTWQRCANVDLLMQELDCLRDKIMLPKEQSDSIPSWFGFPILCRTGKERDDLTKYLNENGIGTRFLFAGNIVKQPCFWDTSVPHRIEGSLANTDTIMTRLLWIGCWHGLTVTDIMEEADAVRRFYATYHLYA